MPHPLLSRPPAPRALLVDVFISCQLVPSERGTAAAVIVSRHPLLGVRGSVCEWAGKHGRV